MDWNAICTYYYLAGFYTIDNVRMFLTKGEITAEQFTAITGQVA